MNINILITSASRKVWLIEAFKRALKNERGVTGKIVSVDTDPLSAALYFSDKHYSVPPFLNEAFIPEIFKICRKDDIRLIVPSADGELPVFARNRARFEDRGIKVMVSDPKVINICGDKYEFYKFLKSNAIPMPETALAGAMTGGSLKFPLMIKPRRGSGSNSIFKAKDLKELKFFTGHIREPIIQEFVEGIEYTVDLFSDFEKKVLTVLPRERIQTVSGESYKTKTVMDWKLMSRAKHVASKLGTVGHITLQFIKRRDSVKLIEINPRFGGGASLGIKAGHDTPSLLIKLIKGEKVGPRIGKFKKGIMMLRYTDDMFLKDGAMIG